jgi:hypothetical protein
MSGIFAPSANPAIYPFNRSIHASMLALYLAEPFFAGKPDETKMRDRAKHGVKS